MRINKVAFIGKGGVGLLYGSMIARALGDDAVEFVMDDARYERHAADQLKINGEPSNVRSVRASEATPADLVILTIKTTGLAQALDTMEAVVGPETRIASLCNGITSEREIAERFGWQRTALGICQGMDAVFLNNELTYDKPGEIRFGAQYRPRRGGRHRRVVLPRGHRPRGRARHQAPHVDEAHDERGYQPNVHGVWRHLRQRD